MPHADHPFTDAETLARALDDPARDAWQRPEDVLRAMELAPTMSVADVGAGTGYFAVRLARAVPAGEVTATDIEPNMVRFVNERARREGLPNLRAILATRSGAGIARESFDRILVVHVWHHLPDRGAFARDLSAALRPGGRLFVVDFAVAARRGPPASVRVAPESIIAELEAAGLTAMISAVAVPDQYIVEARRDP
jgi:2-polyprenyl-3-methyl-5-hydroxy-6-metoxy-1,4-benzoquinol methylase